MSRNVFLKAANPLRIWTFARDKFSFFLVLRLAQFHKTLLHHKNFHRILYSESENISLLCTEASTPHHKEKLWTNWRHGMKRRHDNSLISIFLIRTKTFESRRKTQNITFEWIPCYISMTTSAISSRYSFQRHRHFHLFDSLHQPAIHKIAQHENLKEDVQCHLFQF